MVARSEIDRTLKSLSYKFRKTKEAKLKVFLAKLAIIEVCGWIEEAQDKVLERALSRCVKETANKKKFEKKLEDNSGMSYDGNFKLLVVSMVGYHGCERIEKACDRSKFGNFQRELNLFKKSRNSLAHTHVKGTQLRFDAPDKTIHNFDKVYDGLVEIESAMKRCGY